MVQEENFQNRHAKPPGAKIWQKKGKLRQGKRARARQLPSCWSIQLIEIVLAVSGQGFQIGDKGDHELGNVVHGTTVIRCLIPVMIVVVAPKEAFSSKAAMAHGAPFRATAMFTMKLGALMGGSLNLQQTPHLVPLFGLLRWCETVVEQRASGAISRRLIAFLVILVRTADLVHQLVCGAAELAVVIPDEGIAM